MKECRGMKYKKQTILFLCAGLLVLLAACGKRTSVDSDEEHIYCLNAAKTGLAKVAFELPKGDVEQQVASVLEELAKPPEEIEYVPPISGDVEVRSFEVKNVIAKIDFNKAYLELPVVEEKLVRVAVVRSMLQITGIQGVRLTVEGEELTDADGNPVGVLNEDDFVENTGPSVSSYQTATLTLYFTNATGDRLVEQTVNVRYSSNISLEKIIVEKLMQGPAGGDLYPTLNPAATLLSVTIKDDVCYVNFDSEFLDSTYDVVPEVAVYSLVNSLIDGTSAEQVQIAVNGVTDVSYKDTVELSQPFRKNLELLGNAED